MLIVLLLIPVIGPLLGLAVTIVGAGAWLAGFAPLVMSEPVAGASSGQGSVG